MELVTGLFFVVIAAVIGGILAKLLKLPNLIGYIVAGVIIGAILPENLKSVSSLAGIGTILLLFSIGVELSLDRLTKFFKIAVFGALLQIAVVALVSYLFLVFFGMNPIASLILSLGFSISSTAVLVNILGGRGEMDTIHGGIMFSWSLVQDLAVIPIMVVLPVLSLSGGGIWGAVGFSIIKASLVIVTVVVSGKLIVPYILKFVAEVNSRELLLLTSVGLALGTAAITSMFGISPALGAFLAGVVISESQEHHAVFSEIRPLRDLFVALFFVTLGFLVTPSVIIAKLPLIIAVTFLVIILKTVVVFLISASFGFKGRTGIANAFGLAQVGEFAFVIFSAAMALNLLTPVDTSIGITVTLLTLIISPLLFDNVVPFWRWARKFKLFSGGEKRDFVLEDFSDHIIICGYGRVGKWVGRALSGFGIPFVVVEYNQKVVNELKEGGISVLYGDPTEPEVLEAVGIRNAKAVILAIPDRVAQETLIAYTQSVAPNVKIISRAHLDSDWEKLKTLRVDKIVQPEFEAAIEIIRSVLSSRGKGRDEISEAVKSLRVSHSK
ncbi:MAG TPA: cation:proton antiporter [Patescibacteria group bacterium]|nr:cation:proton antiporter [Patescibacteria group bacterium]